MIITTYPSKPLLYTPKGTLRRQIILDQYADEINGLYSNVEHSTQEDIKAPSVWSISNAESFVRQTVKQTMKKPDWEINDTANIFDFGADR